MERSDEHGDLATALAEARPAPQVSFTEELDERVAAGFPRRSRFSRSPLAGLARRVGARSPLRLSLAGAAAALVAIAIATVVIASSDSGSRPIAIYPGSPTPRPSAQDSEAVPHGAVKAVPHGAAPGSSGSVQYSDVLPQVAATESSGPDRAVGSSAAHSSETEGFADLSRNRDIERSAEIGLLAAPADVADDSAKVFAAVHDADGIVLHSTTSSGSEAGARFALLIPSVRLGDALAAFSAIDEVQSRHEATDDITVPTVSAREALRDSRARIDTLLTQLSAAETETEAAAVEAELRGERRHAARLRARLANLDRRTTYSRVSVRIASDPSADSGGAWGIGDAFGDAGHILGIAAGVTVVGLAVITPLALLAFLAWLAHHLWRRAGRKRALDA